MVKFRCIPLNKMYRSLLIFLPLQAGSFLSYLIMFIGSMLIGISDIVTAPIGPRSMVATGPEEIEAAKWEFENDMERFLEVAEVKCTGAERLFLFY